IYLEGDAGVTGDIVNSGTITSGTMGILLLGSSGSLQNSVGGSIINSGTINSDGSGMFLNMNGQNVIHNGSMTVVGRG
ncbi:MAG: hypothetical protein KDF64_20030, partial [Geminicoccaceae bacterium]|nr:hypothetical protein [Geminicoccaceae bacterium]